LEMVYHDLMPLGVSRVDAFSMSDWPESGTLTGVIDMAGLV
jgi:hypothetical protein